MDILHGVAVAGDRRVGDDLTDLPAGVVVEDEQDSPRSFLNFNQFRHTDEVSQSPEAGIHKSEPGFGVWVTLEMPSEGIVVGSHSLEVVKGLPEHRHQTFVIHNVE